MRSREQWRTEWPKWRYTFGPWGRRQLRGRLKLLVAYIIFTLLDR